MTSVKLFQLIRDDIKVDIEVRFEDEALVIDGYDIGKTVEEYWGDSDYEYQAKILPAGVDRLYDYFGTWKGDKEGLLRAIAGRFNTNTCYSDLLKLLDELKIKYEGWSWR